MHQQVARGLRLLEQPAGLAAEAQAGALDVQKDPLSSQEHGNLACPLPRQILQPALMQAPACIRE